VAELGYIMRPAYLYSRYRPDQIGADWQRLEKMAVEGFKSFLQQHAAEIRTKKPDDAATLLAYLYNMLLLGPLLHGGGAEWKVLRDRNEFARTVATVAYRFLVAGE
jgi:hypothetical protein